jgi:polar amino acid transport system substrate-binding protein
MNVICSKMGRKMVGFIRFAILVGCPLIAVGALAAGAPGAASQPKVLALTVVEGVPALTDGPARVVEAAYRCLGIAIEKRPLPNLRSVAAGQQGQADGDVVRFSPYEMAAPEMLRVPTALLDKVAVAPFVLREQKADLSSVDKIAGSGLRVAVRLGAQFVEGTALSERIAARPKTYTAVFKMLLSGRVDVVLAPIDVFQTVIPELSADFADAGQRVVRLPPVLSLTAYHYLHARHALLVPLINAELARMKHSGSMARLLKQDGPHPCQGTASAPAAVHHRPAG